MHGWEVRQRAFLGHAVTDPPLALHRSLVRLPEQSTPRAGSRTSRLTAKDPSSRMDATASVQAHFEDRSPEESCEDLTATEGGLASLALNAISRTSEAPVLQYLSRTRLAALPWEVFEENPPFILPEASADTRIQRGVTSKHVHGRQRGIARLAPCLFALLFLAGKYCCPAVAQSSSEPQWTLDLACAKGGNIPDNIEEIAEWQLLTAERDHSGSECTANRHERGMPGGFVETTKPLRPAVPSRREARGSSICDQGPASLAEVSELPPQVLGDHDLSHPRASPGLAKAQAGLQNEIVDPWGEEARVRGYAAPVPAPAVDTCAGSR